MHHLQNLLILKCFDKILTFITDTET